MKALTVYQCEFCNKKYKTSKAAFECEAKCLGLTTDEYKENDCNWIIIDRDAEIIDELKIYEW